MSKLKSKLNNDQQTVVNIHEAKTHLSKLLERVHAGEEIILAKSGKPYARLMPLAEKKERVPGALKALLPENIDDSALFEPLPEEELAQFENDLL